MIDDYTFHSHVNIFYYTSIIYYHKNDSYFSQCNILYLGSINNGHFPLLPLSFAESYSSRSHINQETQSHNCEDTQNRNSEETQSHNCEDIEVKPDKKDEVNEITEPTLVTYTTVVCSTFVM